LPYGRPNLALAGLLVFFAAVTLGRAGSPKENLCDSWSLSSNL